MADRRPCRLKALDKAKSYVGTSESPPGSNRGRLVDRWNKWATEDRFPKDGGISGFPWCASFVCGMFREACGLKIPYPYQASVGHLEGWARSLGKVVKAGTRPRRGDLVCYRFTSDDWPDHIGFVDRVIAVKWRGGRFVGAIRTVEGNTSGSDNANGGQVQIRWRSAIRCMFIRVDRPQLVSPREDT